ncbi:MAG: AmmeMemoRadiSam system protein B [Kiritimatiellae bacterium]|nr:AmmeMemoRadiSam system protein B [Kiritimatiellia bacterium]
MNTKVDTSTVRRAYGSGRWFPAGAEELRRVVVACIEEATVPEFSGGPLHALIAPHAGYVYSGNVAGHSYRVLSQAVEAGQAVDTVVVLGFGHREAFSGVALMDGAAIETPLGLTPLDTEAILQLENGSDRIFCDYHPHMGEHSAENQVPFVQVAAPKAQLLMALIGDHEEQTIADLVNGLSVLCEKRRIVVVASTDLLHDADYDRVTAVDHQTLEKIVAMDVSGLSASWSYQNQVCCGITCVLSAMRYAQNRNVKQGCLLQYRNSGDDFPESRGDWVVGYGGVAFCGDSGYSSDA